MCYIVQLLSKLIHKWLCYYPRIAVIMTLSISPWSVLAHVRENNFLQAQIYILLHNF